jgi:hypothetical protein
MYRAKATFLVNLAANYKLTNQKQLTFEELESLCQRGMPANKFVMKFKLLTRGVGRTTENSTSKVLRTPSYLVSYFSFSFYLILLVALAGLDSHLGLPSQPHLLGG